MVDIGPLDSHPYRSPPRSEDTSNVFEIETNDLEATIKFVDENNNIVSVAKNFIGSPSVEKARSSSDIYKYPNYGSESFKGWLDHSTKCSLYELDNLYIPHHRLINITTKITARKQEVLFKK